MSGLHTASLVEITQISNSGIPWTNAEMQYLFHRTDFTNITRLNS